ncbi:MAG: hypothetical protein JRJ24_15015 [Deltaproteobacteria bacterium]|nr:hypothetical protein [Deltaproteobacteria bacterium]
MISPSQTIRLLTLCATLLAVAACGDGSGVIDSENAIIDDLPTQCPSGRPDCWVSQDFPDASELNATNSAGLRFSDDTNSLVVDRVSSLPDSDGDGVPDDADDCPGMPGWRVPCDGDAANDGLYQTVFFDPSDAAEAERTSIAATTADIPKIDVYFLIDATPTLEEEISTLQVEIDTIILDVRASFPDAQFGLGLYREYPLAPLAPAHSQAPYHHILDLTDDDVLVQAAVATLDSRVSNATAASAATQALFTVASGLGLGNMVPNRGSCPNAPDADVGYPCFRSDALHVVMNITDAEVYNGPPMGTGNQYEDPPFAPGVGAAAMNLPPVEMFPGLLLADSAATALDLGDLSGKSLTLMGMSTLLTDQVKTSEALGCGSPPGPLGFDMDGNDVVLALRFDSAIPGPGVSAFANNTHWPGANVALFDDALLDPAAALECDGGTVGVGNWGFISWDPTTSRQYYLVADGIVPATEPGHTSKGAFSISIVHDGDPANSTWLTHDAPVVWTDDFGNDDVETALLASDIRVASVVTLRDAMDVVSDGNDDARLMAAATDALTKVNEEWVFELPSASGAGLGPAISNTIARARTESVYDISLLAEDNDASMVDERDFISLIGHPDCAQGDPDECESGSGNTCTRCDLGALLEYDVVFMNTSVSPTMDSQVFDFEVVVWADDAVLVERIPVRVMVPDSAAHDFDDVAGSSFYRNEYDSTERCNAPPDGPEVPKWGDLRWTGTTPGASTIEFQIRTAPTAAELQLAVPATVIIPIDTDSRTLNLTEELIADGQFWGLPYIQITAVLNATNSPPQTPTLEGWTFEFVCEAAE